ncbi:hypothetical protein J7643_17265 [bacterium]|nr:hypothetical protein [bacterium]
MKRQSALRAMLIATCLALPLLACASEDEDLLAIVSRPTPTPADMEGEIPYEEGPGVVRTPPPTPTPLPSGFDNSGTRPGMLPIQNPRAIGIGRSGDLYVASAPSTLVVLSEFGVVKATASLELLPERFAYLGDTPLYTSGNALVTLDATHVAKQTVRYSGASALAFSVLKTSNQSEYRAVAAGAKVTIERNGVADERDFPEGVAPVSLALDYMGNVWGVGGKTLAKLKAEPSDDPIVLNVADLGNLVGVVIENVTGNTSLWVLGTTGLACYDSAGNRQGGKIVVSGGDRLFVKSGNPVVVKDSAGEICRFKADGTPEPIVKLEGGIAGAAMDAQGNLWVSSLAEGRILHTRF